MSPRGSPFCKREEQEAVKGISLLGMKLGVARTTEPALAASAGMDAESEAGIE